MTTEGLKLQKQWQFLSLTGESIAAAAGPSTMRGEPESTAHTERDEYIMMIPASPNLNQVRVSDESEAIVQT